MCVVFVYFATRDVEGSKRKGKSKINGSLVMINVKASRGMADPWLRIPGTFQVEAEAPISRPAWLDEGLIPDLMERQRLN